MNKKSVGAVFMSNKEYLILNVSLLIISDLQFLKSYSYQESVRLSSHQECIVRVTCKLCQDTTSFVHLVMYM